VTLGSLERPAQLAAASSCSRAGSCASTCACAGPPIDPTRPPAILSPSPLLVHQTARLKQSPKRRGPLAALQQVPFILERWTPVNSCRTRSRPVRRPPRQAPSLPLRLLPAPSCRQPSRYEPVSPAGRRILPFLSSGRMALLALSSPATVVERPTDVDPSPPCFSLRVLLFPARAPPPPFVSSSSNPFACVLGRQSSPDLPSFRVCRSRSWSRRRSLIVICRPGHAPGRRGAAREGC
jgi:hypothetical protein